ncbi:MAG: [protein-PII] uridylyltransferase [Bacteroidota bacterium]|nr:[protein-PII] uridylyltransferase [Bacteroidota bacterium]
MFTITTKELYSSESERIFQLHRSGAEGFAVSAQLSALADSVISELWSSVPSPAKEQCAVFALGGYGRYEMCPHSDFDLMVVCENEKVKEQTVEGIQSFLHTLWDAGFDIGHSVRTLKDCLNLYQTDVDSWAAILESRFVCGSETMRDDYTDAILTELTKMRDLKFVTAIIDGINERHEKYGNSVKLLEPNIKNSAGGLRDLHNLLWMYRSADAEYFAFEPFQSRESSCKMMFETFERNTLISSDEKEAATRALSFMLRTRHEMHYRAKVIHDSLDFPIQREIAKGLGYGNDEELKYVEAFMRDYFLHARTIFRLNRRLTSLYRKTIEPLPTGFSSWRAPKEQILDDIYSARGSSLVLRNSAFEFTSPAQVLKAFYWCGVHSLELGQALQAQFVNLPRIVPLFGKNGIAMREAGGVFLDILKMEQNVAPTLTLMNDFDILGKFIPEWGELVAFFQHSVYHYYTADAHTLIALEHAERLRGTPPKGMAAGERFRHTGFVPQGGEHNILAEAFHALSRKELLYLAILFHDIEKPHGIPDHEVRGVETAHRILQRLHFHDEHDDVAFLIRNHLMMEQVAFRRNISDPATVAEFAQQFETPEQLDLLFVLTYCDLSAVNKNVWTNWKELLLQELYLRARDVLERHLAVPEAISFQQEQYQKSVQTLVGRISRELPRSDVELHFSSIQNEAYVQAFTHDEITEHIKQIRRLDIEKRTDGAPISTIIANENSHSTVTAITRDAPFLLSNLCGVLTANDASIFDAQIFTRDDGTVIDQFRVTDVLTKSCLRGEQAEKIRRDFDDMMHSTVSIEHLFEKHHRRWKRRQKPLLHPNIRIDVTFEDAPDCTIIDVYAPDTTGFLYKVTRAISKLGLSITFAKIATRVDGIVDSFYVVDEKKKPVLSEERRAHIRERILQKVNQLINTQLTNEKT